MVIFGDDLLSDEEDTELMEGKYIFFCFWEWTPSIGRKVGIPRGIFLTSRQGLQIGIQIIACLFQDLQIGIQKLAQVSEGYGQFYSNTT